MTHEIDKRFQFKEVDQKWLAIWEDRKAFRARPADGKKPYTIVIPPPNVTGILHMGHALNDTLQDILIRYKRMQGFEALWMPGTDHAGIATQNVVEKQLAKEGTNRHDVGREELLNRLWSWKQEYGDTIIDQLKKIGSSCDWERTAFTMDDDYSEAVKEVFIRLYRKGLIYRGQRIINWCPRCHTALSDEEAEHKETQGALYHLRYPLKDKPDTHLIVATTRPETMLGDSAVAVHPGDERYKDMIGQIVLLPLVNREIPVIADEFVDPQFGSGAVKVTPAHDPNDFEMGQRHDLASINVMHPDGRINENGGVFSGLDRFEARAAVIAAMEKGGLFVRKEDHQHAVGHCYRCHTVVEPYLSKQWFVKMKPLAGPALKVVEDGTITILPERWHKVYTNWMENIRDWCISRQIWWGHRIPVWYDDEERMYVAKSEEEAHEQVRQELGRDVALRQDEDVLDTWFSSWLWPFATLGWPKESADLRFFYPGDALLTASEIIFFWVARMVMAGIEFMDDIPFKEVYIHGTVRDTQGHKMSKSLGNAIDPLTIVDEYGADALRFSLIMNSGQDLYISKEKFEIGRNFANKIWNAARLVFSRTTEADRTLDLNGNNLPTDLPSRWIICRLFTTIENVQDAIEHFRFSEAENHIYEFFWNHYCDWYLEMIKDQWSEKTVQETALAVLRESLKMIHPFMPFVTEELWEHMNINDELLCHTAWPGISVVEDRIQLEQDMQQIMDIVTAVRNLRAEWNLKPGESITGRFASGNAQERALLSSSAAIIQKLTRMETMKVLEDLPGTKNEATAVIGNIKFAMPLGDLIDIEKEQQRLAKQIQDLQKNYQALDQRLSNAKFLERAPKDVVEKEKDRLAQFQTTIQRLEQVLADLQ